MKSKFILIIFANLLICFNFSDGFGQIENEPEFSPPQKLNNQRRQNVLQELNLSQSQIQQIRRINQGNRVILAEAQARLREANKNLDAAIYSESFDERDIQTKIKDLQLAQAEIIKLRAGKELAIRRVLDADQLSRFRQARQNFQSNTFPSKVVKQASERINRQTILKTRRLGSRGRP